MRKKWPRGSQDYIEELKSLGKALGRSATLSKSKDAQSFREFGGELAKGATAALQFTGGRATISTEPSLVFEAKLSKGLPEKGRAEIVIGGMSCFSEGTLSEQAISMLILFSPTEDVDGLKANRTYIVRKIHFDLDRRNAGAGKPTSHIQIGGNISGVMLAHTEDPDNVERETFDQIDIPRIPSPPYGLASVIDMALREFAPPDLQALTVERTWNELVSRTEKVLLLNYHGRLHAELEGRNTRTNYSYHCDEVVCDM